MKQPTDATGIAMYTCGQCTISNIRMYTAAGFGVYGEGMHVGECLLACQ